MIRATVAVLTLVVVLGAPAAVTAAPEANVIAVSHRPGDSFLEVVVAIPKGIDNAARIGNADWGLQVVVVYVSENGGVETVDSGRVSIADTTFLSSIDNDTVSVQFQLPLGTHSAPSPTGPSYDARAELLNPGSAD